MSIERELQAAFLKHTGGDGKRAEELAEMLGLSLSYLYRACNPDDVAAQLKLSALLPFLKLTKNYNPLRFLARRCGFVLVPIPKRVPRMGPATVAALQAEFLECQTQIFKYSQGEVTKSEMQKEIYRMIETLIRLDRQVENEQLLRLEEPQKCLPLQ